MREQAPGNWLTTHGCLVPSHPGFPLRSTPGVFGSYVGVSKGTVYQGIADGRPQLLHSAYVAHRMRYPLPTRWLPCIALKDGNRCEISRLESMKIVKIRIKTHRPRRRPLAGKNCPQSRGNECGGPRQKVKSHGFLLQNASNTEGGPVRHQHCTSVPNISLPSASVCRV